jgi:huntingtin
MFFGPAGTGKLGQPSFYEQLNAVCRAHNPAYSATEVSWNDNSRAQGSSFGSNITDARLKGKSGEDYLVVRPSNFNERIGRVRASDIALIGGNGSMGCQLAPVTLSDVVRDFGRHGGYAGVPAGTSLASERDAEVGIRFQAVFLPADADPATHERGTEVFPETYNYQTKSWQDPKNVILLCTSQGTFVQQDGPGKVPQYLHKADEKGEWRNVYLDATETRHGVAMGQIETDVERQAALRAGKAVSTVIGTKSMGIGFNRLMTVQIPLKQHAAAGNCLFPGFASAAAFGCPASYNSFGLAATAAASPTAGFGLFATAAASPAASPFGAFAASPFGAAALPTFGAPAFGCSALAMGGFGGGGLASLPKADAHAARVSYGSDAGRMRKMTLDRYERDDTCAITVTVQFYFVVERGRQINDEDIRRAVDVCEQAYSGCSWDGKLMDPGANFAKDQPAHATSSSPGPPRMFPFAQDSAVPRTLQASIAKLDASEASFHVLHTEALTRLQQKTELDAAFELFSFANQLHAQMHGISSASALYNMACCLFVAIEIQIKNEFKAGCLPAAFASYPAVSAADLQALSGMHKAPALPGVEAPKLRPTPLSSVKDLIDERLAAGLMWLYQAVIVGFRDTEHMRRDPDLAVLRLHRPCEFELALRMAAATELPQPPVLRPPAVPNTLFPFG